MNSPLNKRTLHAALLLACTLPRLHAAPVDFAHQIVPILREHCTKCHAGDKKKGGLSMNDRTSLMTGSENGKVLDAGHGAESLMYKLLVTSDKDTQMPPEGPRLSAEQASVVKQWIDEGAVWEEGFAFKKPSYEPPLKPRRPELPAAVEGRENPLDRILDAWMTQHKVTRPAAIDDATFLRRASLDLVGLLPTTEERAAFLADQSPDKRARLVKQLLSRDVEYAEHWLTFWNDLLRNDYSGTGFITGGRRQVTKWLYGALVENKPFDRFTRELINPPTDESRGYTEGIKWRGEVSAGQTVEIQFAQSVCQSFLGINMKCASCHDSFIDRWKLDEAYGLAAVFSTRPLEINRCDKPVGRTAKAAWLFPELGSIDAAAPQPKRLEQLAALMTHPENGRFTRTIVNRLWHRLMGRGIVHPTDAMGTEPWNADLLDQLAIHLQESRYNLKQTLELIATSQAYQMKAEIVARGADDRGYTFAGPRAKRLTAEQFMDAVWQVTDTAPSKFDAPVTRGKAGDTPPEKLTGQWVWASDTPAGQTPPAGQVVTLRKTFSLEAVPARAGAVITADNEYTLFLNGKKILADANWETVESASLTGSLKKGENEIVIQAVNGGSGPNPAAVFFEALFMMADGRRAGISTDTTWQWTHAKPDGKGHFKTQPAWAPASVITGPWAASVGSTLSSQLAHTTTGTSLMVRSSLMKSDFLTRSLGRPQREQIVSMRPPDLNTLEAIDLSNGEVLTSTLERGAKNLLARGWEKPEALLSWLSRSTLGRDPDPGEMRIALESLGPQLTETGVQDLLWAFFMQPEFQIVR